MGSSECISAVSRRIVFTENLNALRDDDFVAKGSDFDDSIPLSYSRPTSATSPSSSLVKMCTYESITAQFQPALVNMPPWLSTVELPTNIYHPFESKINPLPLFRSPSSIHDDWIPVFFSYHRQNINYGRYFWYCDPFRFINDGLLDLATHSESLKYAIAAFSALIYSIQLDQRMKRFTFHFYAKAIQELQKVINTDSIEIYTTVATILELASIEVHPSYANRVL